MAFEQQITNAKVATNRFFRKLLIWIFVLAIIAMALTYLSTKMSYSEGDRAGVVSKFSKKGYVVKTFEGELNVGAQGEAGNMVNNNWPFSVAGSNEEISKQLEDAMLTGKRVKLHYEEKYFKFFWMGDTKYYVTKVEESK